MNFPADFNDTSKFIFTSSTFSILSDLKSTPSDLTTLNNTNITVVGIRTTELNLKISSATPSGGHTLLALSAP